MQRTEDYRKCVGGDVVCRDSFAHLLRHPPPHGSLFVPGGVHGGSAIAGQSKLPDPAIGILFNAGLR